MWRMHWKVQNGEGDVFAFKEKVIEVFKVRDVGGLD